MLMANGVSLRFGKRILFDNVNIKFEGDNCYGLIGANGAGKSTFLKILSGEIEPTNGEVIIGKNERISVLAQDHNKYDEFSVLDTVYMGNPRLYQIMIEKEELYNKEVFTDEDGIKVASLEEEFLLYNGWEAEADAIDILTGLNLDASLFYEQMSSLKDKDKVKVLLAKSLFREPDILLLDEPTNGLDVEGKLWLEEFLINFKNTVIVVSHDRHFLNKICTHTVDIDYEKITLFVGNYDFWYESSQLIQKQVKDSNQKKEEKIAELQAFIRRFSANASKSKQATSRKKLLEKIELDEIKPSSRKYPFIKFETARPLGKEVLTVDNICYLNKDNKEILKNVSFTVDNTDKIAFVGSNEIAITSLFNILTNNLEATSGNIKYGITVTNAYFSKNHDNFFKESVTLVDWLRDYSTDKTESFVRGFLGRMLFSGEESLKKATVLSGGEKVRCMLSKIMLEQANFLILDEPTNHLDIETITALNNGMSSFNGAMLFSTHDMQLIETVANRIIEINNDGTIFDKRMSYNEYLEFKKSKSNE